MNCRASRSANATAPGANVEAPSAWAAAPRQKAAMLSEEADR